MAVRLLFFGKLGDLMGRERTMDLPSGVRTVGALIDALGADNPDAAGALAPTAVRAAVNEQIVDRSAKIADGDEVALMPPFSGG